MQSNAPDSDEYDELSINLADPRYLYLVEVTLALFNPEAPELPADAPEEIRQVLAKLQQGLAEADDEFTLRDESIDLFAFMVYNAAQTIAAADEQDNVPPGLESTRYLEAAEDFLTELEDLFPEILEELQQEALDNEHPEG